VNPEDGEWTNHVTKSVAGSFDRAFNFSRAFLRFRGSVGTVSTNQQDVIPSHCLLRKQSPFEWLQGDGITFMNVRCYSDML
jgi:hypothetical protein